MLTRRARERLEAGKQEAAVARLLQTFDSFLRSHRNGGPPDPLSDLAWRACVDGAVPSVWTYEALREAFRGHDDCVAVIDQLQANYLEACRTFRGVLRREARRRARKETEQILEKVARGVRTQDHMPASLRVLADNWVSPTARVYDVAKSV